MSNNGASSDTPPVLSAGTYLGIERPKLQYVWDRMIPLPGIVVLAGEPFAGKSHFALQLAHALTTGQRFGPRKTTACKVLYLMLESEMVWHELLEKGTKAGFLYHENLFIPHPDFPHRPKWTNIAESATREWIHSMIQACDPDVIIIDPLRDLHSLDEQDSTQMKIVSDAMLALMGGRALVIIHHMKKLSSEITDPDPILSVRGSSQITAKADAVWLLHGKDEDFKDLKVVPRFARRETLSLEHLPDGFWKFTGDPVPVESLPHSVTYK